MKIGMLVGAVGLALASAAQADRNATFRPSHVASDNAALVTELNNRIKANALKSANSDGDLSGSLVQNGFANSRDAAVGAPGSAKRQDVIEGLRQQIRNGEVDPKQVLINLPEFGRKFEDGAASVFQSDHPLRLDNQATPRTNTGDILGGPFTLFDGYESTVLNTLDIDPCEVNTNTELVQYDNNINEAGEEVNASSWYSVIEWDAAVMDCPVLPAPPDPEIGGDGNDHVLLDRRATQNGGDGGADNRVTSTFLGWDTFFENLLVPGVGEPVIVSQDFYFPDDPLVPDNLENQLDNWNPVSFAEGFFAMRVFQRGVSLGDPLANVDGFIDRPQFLGPRDNSFTIGTFYVPPIDPAPGLPTFITKTNEWFSMAFVIEVDRMSVWFRDSGTDGSGAILIQDADGTPGFELGWAEIYPGKDPVNLGAKGGAQIWNSYGRAINQFAQLAPQNQLLAAASVDAVRTLDFADPDEDALPDFSNRNYAYDNLIAIGPELEEPPQPKATLDPKYIDDIELYVADGLLRFQGDTWFDALSSLAVIDDDIGDNTTASPGSNGPNPRQSIRQRNETEDSRMRSEFNTGGMPGGAGRPFATPTSPVEISATIKLSNTTTVRAMDVNDGALDATDEFLLTGATNPDDSVEPFFHIRLPNPLFVIEETEAGSNRVDDRPPLDGGGNFDLQELLDRNPTAINYPTTFSSSLNNTAFRAILRLYGDGTAQWLIEHPLGTTPQEVVFDPTFYNIDPELSSILVDGVGGNAPDGSFEGFQSDMRTVTNIAFWSGNNVAAFFDTINVDDVMVQGETRQGGVGPVFELPYCDDLDVNYNLDELMAGQGDTPFIGGVPDQGVNVSLNNSNVLVDDTESDLPGMSVEWCSYTVTEVIEQFDRKGNPLPNDWDIMVGDVVNSKVEQLFTAAPPCPADINGSGDVGSQDLALLLGDWGNVGGAADLNGGGVGSQDLALLLGAWGPCPTGDPIAFSCPDPSLKAEEGNLVLIDPDGVLNPCVVNVTLSGTVMNTGVNDPNDSTFWTCFSRFQDGELFCRYELVSLEPEIDPFDDLPFDECPDWQIGDIIAIDQIFAVNPDTGFADCPGSVDGATSFDVFQGDCLVCEGTWILQGSQPDLDCQADPGATTPAAEEALDSDIRGFAFGFANTVRWNSPLLGGVAGGGTNEDGILRVAQNEIDSITLASIDPTGAFGQVAAYINNGGFDASTTGLFTSNTVIVPEADSSATENACLYWDMYIQDINTQTGLSVFGSEPGDSGQTTGGTLITTIDFGGPDISPFFSTVSNEFPIPATNIAVRVRNPNTGGLGQQPSVFIDTGVAVPVGQWFRTCLCLREDGTWKLGINTSGDPGGPAGLGGDVPEHFDDTLPGAHPDAQLVADGSITVGGQNFPLISIGSHPDVEPAGCIGDGTVLPITDITNFSIQQNFNDDGDGDLQLAPIVWEALDPSVAAPNGNSAGDDDAYCFYEVQIFDGGSTPPDVVAIDVATGDAIDEVDNGTGMAPADGVPDRRSLAGQDVVCLKWETTVDFSVQSFDDCPEILAAQDPTEGLNFELVDGAMTVLATGEFQLLSDTKDLEGAESVEGGVSNSGGPDATGRGYDGNRPGGAPFVAGMLMGCFVTVPTEADPEVSSRWWVDNIKVQVEAN